MQLPLPSILILVHMFASGRAATSSSHQRINYTCILEDITLKRKGKRPGMQPYATIDRQPITISPTYVPLNEP
ncbi:hypothetical protein F4779DRAFT_467730 [Xylariaceae sp. FL0662B]|nr:hypothetical protein F4779DRAFT_467730 [Xylariaceae sp. FL0662B]